MPPRGVRPTQDRVREALFAILGDRVQGARFLDLYAGSGSVGLEAWSRGADFVCWVETNRRVLATLKKNVEELCPDRARVVPADVGSFLGPGCTGKPFDLVFADPPYAVAAGERNESQRSRTDGTPWLERLLRLVSDASIMADTGILVVEQGAGQIPPSRPGWALMERVYGRSRLCFFCRSNENPEELDP